MVLPSVCPIGPYWVCHIVAAFLIAIVTGLSALIHHNNFQGIGAGPKKAIVIGTGAGNGRSTISQNIIKAYNTGIWLSAAGVNDWTITDDNRFSGNTNDIVDSGTSNKICVRIASGANFHKQDPDGSIRKWGSGIVALNASGDGVVSLATAGGAFPTAFDWGQVNNGDPAVQGSASFCVNQTASSTSHMAFSVRPNPGAWNVRVMWEARGR